MTDAPKSALPHDLIQYDRQAHEGFVLKSWVMGARRDWVDLSRYLRRPETRCLVAHVPGDPDSLLGWVAVTGEGAVIWLYCRALYGKVRLRGLGASMLRAAGVDVTQPTPCLFWSPAAAAIAASGAWRIYHQPFGAARKVA